jgi:putative Mg2+ transporter-C (MgtC) family protein
MDLIALDPISQLTNNWLAEFNIWTIIIRLALAFIIGASFGFERSRKRHTAGFRTFTFVALFSTIAALLDVYFMANFKVVFPAVTTAVVLGGAIISGNTLLYSSKTKLKV